MILANELLLRIIFFGKSLIDHGNVSLVSLPMGMAQ
jgi:hypothetical protein